MVFVAGTLVKFRPDSKAVVECFGCDFGSLVILGMCVIFI